MTERKTILVVVGQDALALAVWRALLARRADLDVHVARSPEALSMLVAHAEPSVAIVDVEHANADALARMRRVAACGSSPRIVAIAREKSPHIDDILSGEGADAVVHTPVDVAPLVDTVGALLGAEDTMQGRVSPVGVLDLVQMLCLARRTASVRFEAPDGRGGIWLENGDIVHAMWTDAVGMEALVRLTVLESGTFRCTTGVPAPRRTITDNWRQSLMNAACLADERRRGESSADTLTGAPVVAVNAHAQARNWRARYEELIELGLAAMRGGDLAAARVHWNEAKQLQEANDPEQREVETRPSRPTLRGIPASA
jgi:CheY-like chemotaxis protein